MPVTTMAFAHDYTDSVDFPNPKDGGPAMRIQIDAHPKEIVAKLNSEYMPLINLIEKTASKAIASVGGTAAAITGSVSPTPATYDDLLGVLLAFKPTLDSAATPTINLNTMGAKAIKKNTNQDLVAGDMVTGGIYVLVYDGTNFQLLNPPSNRAKGSTVVTTDGSGLATINFGKTLVNPVTTACVYGSNNIVVNVNSSTATNFVIKAFWADTGAVVGSGTFQVNWLAQGD